jgi:hypothetical protein
VYPLAGHHRYNEAGEAGLSQKLFADEGSVGRSDESRLGDAVDDAWLRFTDLDEHLQPSLLADARTRAFRPSRFVLFGS